MPLCPACLSQRPRGITPAGNSRNEQIGSLNRAPQMAPRVLAQLRVEEDRVTYQFGKRVGNDVGIWQVAG